MCKMPKDRKKLNQKERNTYNCECVAVSRLDAQKKRCNIQNLAMCVFARDISTRFE